MPKTILDYSKTIMYKIVCKDLNVKDCYVGHTTDMTKRKCCHKHVCNNEKNKDHNLKIYKIIRENGGWDNWTMVLVETFPCKDKHEACRREREVFEELDAKMNTLRPYITQEEFKDLKQQYYQEHKEEHKEKHKKYCEEYYQEHKEDLKQNQKKYREEHEEEIKKYLKQYREKNKEKIAEKMKEKIECEFCSKLLQKCSMSRHYKTCKSKPREMNEIIEKNKEKIECEFCSKLLQKCSMSRHLKICKSKPKEDK